MVMLIILFAAISPTFICAPGRAQGPSHAVLTLLAAQVALFAAIFSVLLVIAYALEERR